MEQPTANSYKHKATASQSKALLHLVLKAISKTVYSKTDESGIRKSIHGFSNIVWDNIILFAPVDRRRRFSPESLV